MWQNTQEQESERIRKMDAKNAKRRAAESEECKAIQQHVIKRFDELEKILKNNPDIYVVIAGDPNAGHKIGDVESSDDKYDSGAEGHRLGAGYAKEQWQSQEEWKSVIREIDDKVHNILEHHHDKNGISRVSIGNIGNGSDEFPVTNQPGEKCIHVWGANASNWNLGPGKKINGEGQASGLGEQRFGLFGIVTTPVGMKKGDIEGLQDRDKTYGRLIDGGVQSRPSDYSDGADLSRGGQENGIGAKLGKAPRRYFDQKNGAEFAGRENPANRGLREDPPAPRQVGNRWLNADYFKPRQEPVRKTTTENWARNVSSNHQLSEEERRTRLAAEKGEGGKRVRFSENIGARAGSRNAQNNIEEGSRPRQNTDLGNPRARSLDQVNQVRYGDVEIRAIGHYINNNNDDENSDYPVLSNFRNAILLQKSNPRPKLPYRGIGLKVSIIDQGLQIDEVFSPNLIERFRPQNNIKIGKIITHVLINEEPKSVQNLSQKQIAEAFHSKDEIKFVIDGEIHSCDNNVNRTAIFSPRDNGGFGALSEISSENISQAAPIILKSLASLENSLNRVGGGELGFGR